VFFPYDTTNEIIAHFIGYFELSVEDMRFRLDYQEFAYRQAADALPEDHVLEIPELAQRYSLADFNPDAVYVAPEWAINGNDHFRVPTVELAGVASLPNTLHREPGWQETPDQGRFHSFAPQESTDLLSAIAFVNQTITLEDNDVIILGEFSGSVVFVSGSAEAILNFQAQAHGLIGALIVSPDLDDNTSIADFIVNTAARVDQLADAPELEGASVIVTPAGTYVNGELSDEAPDLIEHLPVKLAEFLEPPEDITENEVVSVPGTVDHTAPSLTLNAGGNLLMNDAVVVNGGLNTSIMAVQGNYHQLDAIIQINAYSDHDTILGAPGGGLGMPSAQTLAYNIASFETESRDSLGRAAEVNPGGMPLSWNVTVVSGDLIFVEWMKQFTFQSDQDLHVLSATGGTTMVTTGENIGLNFSSFVDLGKYFDLVIVGGSLYDANIIVQTNILYDNDTIQYLGDNHANAGNVSTGGNLLWNEASILNVGPGEVTTGMPDHFSEAASTLSSGGRDMPKGFGDDGLFEGLNMLRVLYVAGDIYDLRYLQQTNVLGDADFVALQQAKLIGDNPGTNWDINTGANALVNKAQIIDYDGMGDTAYVGGEHYSDSILIQANILSADNGGQTGDALVNEVIAFLDHDVPDVLADDGPYSSSSISHDGPPADIMQSVLA